MIKMATQRREIISSALGRDIGEAYDDRAQDNFLFDRVVYDSDVEKKAITSDPKKVDDIEIKVFAKLPRFHIATPYSYYQPDFAYLAQDSKGSKIF